MNAGLNDRVWFGWPLGVRTQPDTLSLLEKSVLIPGVSDEERFIKGRAKDVRLTYPRPVLSETLTGWEKVADHMRDLESSSLFCNGHDCIKLQASQLGQLTDAGLTCFKLSHIGTNSFISFTSFLTLISIFDFISFVDFIFLFHFIR